MKYKVTKKEIMAGFDKVIKVGYCNLQYLLNFETPESYVSSRTYGWQADVYNINGVAIVTGYGPFGNIDPDYDTLKMYNTKAEKIIHDYSIDYEDRVKMVHELIRDFIGEVTN